MMQNWQDWVVALIVALCVARVGMSLWGVFRKTRPDSSNPCAHCPEPCAIKRQYDQKVRNCRLGKKKNKKSCCG